MDKKNPLVSVITTCYNEERYLDNYFKGLLSQTYNNIQVIFINDGSQDDSENIYYSNKKVLDQKLTSFIYLYQENKGYISAINKGFQYIKGDYICLFDADDIMMPHKIESHVEFLKKNKDCHLVFSDGYIVSEKDNFDSKRTFLEKYKEVPRGYVYERIFNNDFIMSGTYCFRKDCLEKIPNLEESFDNRGQNLQILAAITHFYKVGYNDVPPVMKYVVHGDSMSKRKILKNLKFQTFVRKELDYYLINKYGVPREIIRMIEAKYLIKEYKYYFITMDKNSLEKTYRDIKNEQINEKHLYIAMMYLIHKLPFLWKLIIMTAYPDVARELDLSNKYTIQKK